MSGPLRLRHRVLESIRRHGLWVPGASVAVAVSGGRDSVVLLDVLACTRRAHGGELTVVTVDHGMRPGSAEDLRFVASLAEHLALPFVGVQLAPAGASEAHLRAARQAVFDEQVAAGAVVALGHHRQDQAETLMLQLMRGGGTRARRGMLPSTRGRVRPLLDVAPEDLGAWAQARGLSWREDPTNASRAFTRNRIRHEVLPLLNDVRAGTTETLARSARLAALDDACLATLASQLPLEVQALAAAPEALARRAVQQAWPDLRAAQVDDLLGAVGLGHGRVVVGAGRALVVRDGHIATEVLGDGGRVVTSSKPALDGPEEPP